MLSACQDSRRAVLRVLSTYIQPQDMERKIRHHPEDTILLWQNKQSTKIRFPPLPVQNLERYDIHDALIHTLKDIKHLAVINYLQTFTYFTDVRNLIYFPSLERITLLGKATGEPFEIVHSNNELALSVQDFFLPGEGHYFHYMGETQKGNIAEWYVKSARLGRKVPAIRDMKIQLKFLQL
jgi:hypothetical protein